jgi:hypothetical protein
MQASALQPLAVYPRRERFLFEFAEAMKPVIISSRDLLS